ncbi:hypothetical protein [Oceanitalea stevensii]|uniref:Lipoprotein n=1 Tax=Oceanitalea stevensii TaxID=2763072 RepID=A0ABR8YZ65_9MICO|nr:hypothetical protein [Oceanitalea stevensii]MBD8060914.1 hypothetical protein [Oceanitalea stevensii]
MRVRPATVTVIALVLVLAGCGPGPEPPSEPPSPTSSPSLSVEPPTTPQPEPDTAAGPEGPTLPPELAARMPPEEEIDGLVLEAEAAYVDHRAAYDAAASTGFTDPDLVETLFATATGDVLDALEAEATALAGVGRVVDGRAEVLGTELHSLLVPEEDGTGFGVALGVCLHIEGALEESDGSVVYELDGEPVHLVVRLTVHEGTWRVATQSVQEGPCPEGLGP